MCWDSRDFIIIKILDRIHLQLQRFLNILYESMEMFQGLKQH
jgi:hypothetical protein